MTTTRIQYTQQQVLRAADLTGEQEYRLAAQRRHLLSLHIWGIVQGLRLHSVSGGFIVMPGYAVDGFGRELVLPYPIFTPWATDAQDLFDDIADAALTASGQISRGMIDVWLLYARVPADPPRQGRQVCEPLPPPRWRDDVRLCLTAVYQGGAQAAEPDIAARRPPAVPPELIDYRPHQDLPDERLPTWPVYLGRLVRQDLRRQGSGEPSVEQAGRPYAGLAATSIVSASRVAVAEDPANPPAAPLPPVPSIQLVAHQAGDRRRVSLSLADAVGAPADVLTLDSLSGATIRATTRLVSPPPQPNDDPRDPAVDLCIEPVTIKLTEADIDDPETLACLLQNPNALPGLPLQAPAPESLSSQIHEKSMLSDSSPLAQPVGKLSSTKELTDRLNRWIDDPRPLDTTKLFNLPLRQVTRQLLKASPTSRQSALARRALFEDLFHKYLATRATLPAAYGIEFRPPPKPVEAPAPWRVYCVEIERDGKKVRQLRIEIGTTGDKNHPERSRFQIGRWSESDEKKAFAPCLSIDEACTVEMHGDLTVVGDVIETPTPVEQGSRGLLEQLAEQWQRGIAEGLAGQASLTVEIRNLNAARVGSSWPYDVYIKNTGPSPINFISILENVSVAGNIATRTAATIPSLPVGAETTAQITHSDPNLPALDLAAGSVGVMITVLGFGATFNAIYVSKGKSVSIIS